MRTISKWLVAIAAVAAVAGSESAQAGFIGMTRALGPMVKRISFSSYTLPPMRSPSFACVTLTSASRSASYFGAARCG
jgi:hypothetical protein